MKNLKFVFLLIAAVALGGASMWALMSSGEKGSGGEKSFKSTFRRQASTKDKSFRKRPGTRRTVKGDKIVERSARLQPTFDIGAEEEAKLNESQRKLLEEIRAALKADNWRKLMALVQKLQTSNEWPDGIPIAIRRAAVDALSFYGSKCLPELVGFLGDANPEIVDVATESFWDAVTDPDLSDAEIETNLLAAMKSIKDADSIKDMLSEVITTSMRNSRAVDTIKQIMSGKNEVAKAELKTVMEELTDDPNVTTVEQLEDWLKQHPDEPDDEEFYGGSKDDEE